MSKTIRFFQDKANGGSAVTEILIIIAMILISILGIMIIRNVNHEKAEERAKQRVADLRILKTAVENHRAYFGVYPNTNLDISELAQRYKKFTYPYERWNECDKPDDWIPHLVINLPSDPSHSCGNKHNSYPRYEYVSDGRNYKILAYRLGDEICARNEYKELIDPARPCSSYDASWAVYSFEAKDW